MSVNNSLVEKQVTFSAFLTKDAVKNKINEVVGGKDGQTFMTAILSAVTNNEALQQCDQMSILNCAFLGQALKLSPSPQLGQYYMVPFNDNKRKIKVAQFQLGYKGYIQLALRSGYYKDMDVLDVREGEYLGRDKTTGKYKFEFMEDDDERESKPIVGYMAYFEYLNGFTKVLYWSKQKMLKHADKYSQAFSLNATSGKYPKVSYADYLAGKVLEKDMWLYSSYWYKDFDGMAFKTMLRQLISKWGIMSVEMEKAYNADMGTIAEDGKVTYVENDVDKLPDENIEPTQNTDVIEGNAVIENEETANENTSNENVAEEFLSNIK